MKTTAVIKITFKHASEVNFETLKDVIITGIREAFRDDIKAEGDVTVSADNQKVVGGITLYDILHYANGKGIDLPNDAAKEVLERCEEYYDNSGRGFHGDELIQYAIDNWTHLD